MTTSTTTNPVADFTDAMRSAGLTPPDNIVGDGAIHRFGTNNKRADKAGWYILHLDNVPAGIFGNWRDGRSETWCSIDRKEQTPEEKEHFENLIKSMREARDTAIKNQHDSAAKIAVKIWAAAKPIEEGAKDAHGYLTKKGIQAHGARVIEADKARSIGAWLSPEFSGMLLVIPMRNHSGEIRTLQFINSDGDKRFLTGGEKQGCYFSMGGIQNRRLIVCEGYATGASIHEATGAAVIVALDCGNLGAVSKALKKQHPALTIVIGADDDYQTDGNPGMTAAKSAAMAVGGVVVAPIFPATRTGETDFNDLRQMDGGGVDAVRNCFTEHLKPEEDAPTGEPEPSSDIGASPFPGMDGRPTYVVLDDWVKSATGKHRPGVYECGITAGKKDAPPEPFNSWICSPLHLDAITFDGQSNNFGRLLRFKPTVGKWREWAMPMELLAGDGIQLRGELLAMGMELDPRNARQQLPLYLQYEHPKKRVQCALQVGWCGDSFVLPDTVIGPKAADVIFQSGERGHDEHTQSGTLAGWRDDIAAKAIGNQLLTLAISASFSGPLLARCNAESGGIHFYGGSSTGKTTLVKVACSTWGGAGFMRTWRATANGLEGAAAMFNDCLLALDEVNQCDPRQVGEIVYMIGNGHGKQRAGRTGNARKVTRWSCCVLSSGEYTIGTVMANGGHRINAGQTVRLLDIPANQAHGAFDNLHGAEDGDKFSITLRALALKHHGHAGRAFLERLTRDTKDYADELAKIKTLPLFTTDGAEGQDKRAAARFALIGLAGELATEYGLTGWTPGDALKSAAHGLKQWQSTRTKGNIERWQIADSVRSFIEKHGDSRFSNADYIGETPMVRDRAGWFRDTSTGREYLFTAAGMNEALKGFDFKRALDTLQELGALPPPGADGKRARFQRFGGHGAKVYPITLEKLEGGNHGS